MPWFHFMDVMFYFSINFEAGRGSLIAIVGQVGCGKSSIISALLGEMQKQHGTVTVNVCICLFVEGDE